MAAGFSRQVRTRPRFVDSTRPTPSSTRTCFIRLGRDISNGWASSPIEASPSPKRLRTALLVGSARAPNTRSRLDDKLSIRLTISALRGVVNNSYPYGLLIVRTEAPPVRVNVRFGWKADIQLSGREH